MPDAAHPDPSDTESATAGRAASRADDLLPEERAAGTDDPDRQAEAILADSDDREGSRLEATDAQEHRS